MKKDALLLFIKAPLSGKIKTRLQPELNEWQTLILYKAFVEDLIARFKDSTFFDLHIFFYPDNSRSCIETWLGNELNFYPQTGKDLGEKMSDALQWAFEHGYEKALLIGSDIPTLNVARIEEAFNRLEQFDIVIGPTHDGGYCLIGIKEHVPELFENIQWSTNVVLDETLQKVHRYELSGFQLPKENDIDDFEDVLQLWEILRVDGIHEQTKTYAVLKKILSGRKEIEL